MTPCFETWYALASPPSDCPDFTVMVRPDPMGSVGSLTTGGVAVGGGPLILAESGGFGADGEHEPRSNSVTVKKTA